MKLVNTKTSPRRNIIYTKEEAHLTTCCFNLFSKDHEIAFKSQDRVQRQYSQPRLKKQKKIDLVIAKKGTSLPKNRQYSEKLLISKDEGYQHQLKTMQNTGTVTSLNSKVTTQKNSLKNSRARLTLDHKKEKHDKNSRYQKYIVANNQGKQNPSQLTIQTKGEIVNIQLLSEISVVQQEFISHGSTLNALNYLNILPSDPRANEYDISPVRYMIDAMKEKRMDQLRQTPNPLTRMIEKKRMGLLEGQRHRLCL